MICWILWQHRLRDDEVFFRDVVLLEKHHVIDGEVGDAMLLVDVLFVA